ncbi:hypothetical protein HanRHA438_Chr01g0016011 [Helianthus annuus]|uniref:Fringe-related protein n=1 Tax=Helianthus annuus TaxID=4232 RepID=A0A251VPR9_HELAN|nr:uncharacterized protein LOC110936825 [Helianthus annuus]KAF5821575.1 hypothetical protein HanXRQr2_Chr01g0015611 [Helianthus annuus]KAJ0622211.1 hypothetical protein HanIR_Chr01g0017441 [Helianthus annuus]KAJ0782840.1 hypothetical protein HanLR1_Chr01g0012781 [Helianthus annuus]KAJ0947510.1 hypothetical protein HanRHA438_Chr01g0016011 [Helianthus annuus]KAJ0956465.1 hypothetical protein HanPSC8_Chr01g0015131 [Helianthus annuus]
MAWKMLQREDVEEQASRSQSHFKANKKISLNVHFICSLIKMFTQIHKKPTMSISKPMIISLLSLSVILMLISILIFSTNSYSQTTQILIPSFNLNYFKNTHNTLYPNQEATPTNISHIVFSISGAVKTWHARKHYVESWWRPNGTRGFLFFDQAPIQHLPWPPTSPRVYVSNETMSQKGVPYTIRIARIIKETFNAENKGVRWYVMGDDDTIFFLDNLVDVLNKYDHNGYYYVGMNSESVISNSLFSFVMGFGGAGLVFSYPLANILAKNLDVCLERYKNFHGGDHILQSCVADLGVSLTQVKGFHQIDLHEDISGLLSAHPQTPLVSLHHLDMVEPIFPTMDRPRSLDHLMKSAKADQSRLLQQSICYNHPKNWSFSLSWGYSVHIYEKVLAPSLLQVPIQTFAEWRKGAKPAFMMNTRGLSKNRCDIPHYFYLDSVEEYPGGGERQEVVTSYVRRFPRLPPCLMSGSRSANVVEKILVISPVTRLETEGRRRECCDIVQVEKENVTTIKLRPCMQYEIIG